MTSDNADAYTNYKITFNGITYSIQTKTQGTETKKNIEYLIFSF